MGATIHVQLRVDAPPKLSGTRMYDPRATMIQIVSVRAQGFGVKYVFVGPRSGFILGATIHDTRHLDGQLPSSKQP